MKQISPRNHQSLKDYVDCLQARGRYTFLRSEAQAVLKSTDTAFKFAANRLSKKGRIASPRRGFFVIVPTEYRLAGAPPATWFIDDLMKFHEMPYYVGLLSAAALHGAAHQQPQEFQIVTLSPLRSTQVGREKIKFFTKKQIARTRTEKIKGSTGFFPISSPEATAFDLVRYFRSAGYLSVVATVLDEMSEKITPIRLVNAAKVEDEVANAQRLGYLLDYLKAGKLTAKLHKWVKGHARLYVPLIPTRKLTGDFKRNSKWMIIVNEEIEVDR